MGTKEDYSAPYTQPWRSRESRDEQGGAASKRKGFQKVIVKQTECLHSATGEEKNLRNWSQKMNTGKAYSSSLRIQ